jgi:flagellar biosynthesis protein FliR
MGIAIRAAQGKDEEAKRSRRMMLRCLSFGLLSMTLAALILAGNSRSPDHLVMALLPEGALGALSPRMLLFIVAAISLAGCIIAETALRLESHKRPGHSGD